MERRLFTLVRSACWALRGCMLSALFLGCSTTSRDAASAAKSLTLQDGSQRHSPWESPPLQHAISVRDGRSGERIPFEAMIDALSSADAAFLGETHVDETTHQVELAVYEGLLARRRVVLAL